jgi:hypothetical protein
VGAYGATGGLSEEPVGGGMVLCKNNLSKNPWWEGNGKQYLLVSPSSQSVQLFIFLFKKKLSGLSPLANYTDRALFSYSWV